MHIPDGYLSPQTYIPLAAAFVAVTVIAVKKVKNEASSRDVPYLGMAAAYHFFIHQIIIRNYE
ncbi:MAG: energy-coupling factor ABC transporter permease [Bacteroidales bacterium]